MATLGCSTHVAFIQSKCQGPRLCELLNASTIYYDRRLDDISEAFVEIPISGDVDDPCCSCLGDVEPWCHLLTIVREGDGVVWTGPVQRVIYGYDLVRIEARDKLAWLTVRVNEITLTGYNPNTLIPLTTIAKDIATLAMADEDSSCFLDCVLDMGDGLPPGTDRSREDFVAFEGPTAFDDFMKMADSGVDYTVVNQCLILTGSQLPPVAIGTLTDEHILGDIKVIKDGDQLGNRFWVRYTGDDEPPCDLTPCPGMAEGDQECYGLVERIIPNDLGIPSASAADEAAQTFVDASRIVPRLIQFPPSTRLSPNTPWGINDMIPGQRVDVALSKLCLELFQSFKLQTVEVRDSSSDGEEISIDLTSLNTVLE